MSGAERGYNVGTQIRTMLGFDSMYTQGMTAVIKWLGAGAVLLGGLAKTGLQNPSVATKGFSFSNLELPAFALLAGVIYWLLGSWERAQKRQTAANERAAKRHTEALDRVSRSLQYVAVLVVQHDATVRGINPETLGTTEDLLDRVEGIVGTPDNDQS